MIRTKGRYERQTIALEAPLNLPEGAAIEVVVRLVDDPSDVEEFAQLGMDRLEQDWDNPEDALYDNWKR